MLRRIIATAFVLLVPLSWVTGGCGTSPSVEQEVPGTERIVLQIDGMT